jgi:phosphate transport system protein
MVRHFVEELKQLKKRLLYMGNLVEEMINNAIKSIVEQDEKYKDEVIKHEDEVNIIQIEIDEWCIKMLALHQPAAKDLRFLASAMKINSELERMADQAMNIIGQHPEAAACMPEKQLEHIIKMSEYVKNMVRGSLDAFIKKDEKMAKEVLLEDDKVDQLKYQVFKESLQCMIDNSNIISNSVDIILISRHLERIGDHATNICEDVIYMVVGKDIRHHIQDKR